MAAGEPANGSAARSSRAPGGYHRRAAEHDDLGAGVGNAADRVQELTLDEHPALDLQAQRHEEGGHDVEICDREADVVEASYM